MLGRVGAAVADTVPRESIHLRAAADAEEPLWFGPSFLYAGTVLGSSTFQDHRVHQSIAMPSKLMVLLMRIYLCQQNM